MESLLGTEKPEKQTNTLSKQGICMCSRINEVHDIYSCIPWPLTIEPLSILQVGLCVSEML